MAFSQAQLDALEKAFASGTLTVEYEGKRVTYRSLAELERILSHVRKQVKGAEAAPRFSLAAFSKG